MTVDVKELLGQKIIEVGEHLVTNSDIRSDKEQRVKFGLILISVGAILLEMQKADYNLPHENYYVLLDNLLETTFVMPEEVINRIEGPPSRPTVELSEKMAMYLAFELKNLKLLNAELAYKSEQMTTLIHALEDKYGLDQVL